MVVMDGAEEEEKKSGRHVHDIPAALVPLFLAPSSAFAHQTGAGVHALRLIQWNTARLYEDFTSFRWRRKSLSFCFFFFSF
eukprot:gene11620-8008_t